MAEKIISDSDIARHQIFGQGEDPFAEKEPEPTPDPVDPPVDPVPEPEPPVDPIPGEDPVPPVDPQDPAPVDPVPDPVPEPPVVNYDEIPDDKFLELFNKKFNANFDTVSAAGTMLSEQLKQRGQEDIIQKLVAKVKENTNVLSHFPNENAYKIAQLSKDDPGKQEVFARIVNSDIKSLSDLEAIEMAARAERPSGSKVNALNYKLRQLGLTDDVKDFEDWDANDKEVVIGAAEDARMSLEQLQTKVEVPSAEGTEVDEFVAGIESGFQESTTKQTELIENYTPVAASMVDSLTTIKPVEGSDFEFTVNLDAEGKKDLTDFLISESIEGEYDIKSDTDVRRLNGALKQEIWATDGAKIAEAYGNFMETKGKESERALHENATPLNADTPPPDNKPVVKDDNDYARNIINPGS